MTTNLPEPIASVLCSSEWTWNPDDDCTVQFNVDGTGDLFCGVELNVFIASQFDWKLRSKAEEIPTELPASIEVEMTLTKRELKDNPPPISHTALNEAAFEPKVYRLQLERGAFKVEHRTHYGFNPTYEYRLLWDPSPYPPLEEWNNKPPARGGKYWERKDFYKSQLQDTK